MIRFAWLMILSLAVTGAVAGQEVIVFSDQRSLVVASHREQGPWTYLRVDGGEIAVKTVQIDQIRKEGAEAQQSARAAVAATPSPSGGGPAPDPPKPTPPRPAPPPPPEDSDEEDLTESRENQPPKLPRGMGPRVMPSPAGRPPAGAASKRQGAEAGGGR